MLKIVFVENSIVENPVADINQGIDKDLSKATINVFFNALPTGGFTTMITTKITIIIMAPSTLVIVSMALLAFFSTNTRIAKRPASM